MRDLHELDAYRDTSPEVIAQYGSTGDSTCGRFQVPAPSGEQLRVIASSGSGWDHVSVSAKDRCPSWDEMEWIKHKFFKPDETAMQLHVPASAHINCHPYCLHLWRPKRRTIPRPPAWMVAPQPRKETP